jgi:hypothetical protein
MWSTCGSPVRLHTDGRRDPPPGPDRRDTWPTHRTAGRRNQPRRIAPGASIGRADHSCHPAIARAAAGVEVHDVVSLVGRRERHRRRHAEIAAAPPRSPEQSGWSPAEAVTTSPPAH